MTSPHARDAYRAVPPEVLERYLDRAKRQVGWAPSVGYERVPIAISFGDLNFLWHHDFINVIPSANGLMWTRTARGNALLEATDAR